MKRKQIIVIILFLIIFNLLIYLNKNNNDVQSISNLRINNLNEYTLIPYLDEHINLNKPKGIINMPDGLLIADSGNNRLLYLNNSGNIKKIIGKIGNGPYEFIDPTSITIDKKNNIYIIDNGNLRIQILNKNLEYIKSIKLDEFRNISPNSFISDIAVDDNLRIYISLCSIEQKYSHIYYIEPSGIIKNFGKNKYGYLITGNSELFFAQYLELINNKNQLTIQSGKNSLYKINNGRITKTCKLPDKYAPKDGFILDNNIYIINGAFCTIDKLDLSGKYIGSLINADKEYLGFNYMCYKDKSIYVTNTTKNSLYKFELNNKNVVK